MASEIIKFSDNISFCIDTISDRKYWFVRTDSGKYFEEYKNEGFVGIGYNVIKDVATLNKAKNDRDEKNKLKTLVTNEIKTDDDSEEPRVQIGWVINQLLRFMEDMNVGDIVFIPSINSQYILFGEVTSEFYFEAIHHNFDDKGKCPFEKRRKIKWIKTISRDSLDPYLYKAIYSHHIITDVTELKDNINRTLSDIYIEDNKLHITFRVNTKEDIHINDLIPILNIFNNIADIPNIPTETSATLKNHKVKLNLQSPGPIEYIFDNLQIITFAIVAIYLIKATKDNGGHFDFKFKDIFHFSADIKSPKYDLNDNIKKAIEGIKDNEELKKQLKETLEAANKLEVRLPSEEDSKSIK